MGQFLDKQVDVATKKIKVHTSSYTSSQKVCDKNKRKKKEPHKFFAIWV